MSFLQTIKEVVAWKKDEEFFDKEATIKEYFKVCPPDKRRKVNSYDELGSIRVIDDEGEMISIIENGRFVLPGTEELNRPFENLPLNNNIS